MSEPAFNFVPTANRSKAHNKGVDAQSHEHLIHGTIPRTLAKNYLLGKQISLTTPVLTGLHQALPGLAAQVIAAGKAGASLGKHIQGAEMMSLEELVYHPSFDWGVSGAKPMGCSRNPRTPLIAKFNQFRGVSAELLPANPSRRLASTNTNSATTSTAPVASRATTSSSGDYSDEELATHQQEAVERLDLTEEEQKVADEAHDLQLQEASGVKLTKEQTVQLASIKHTIAMKGRIKADIANLKTTEDLSGEGEKRIANWFKEIDMNAKFFGLTIGANDSGGGPLRGVHKTLAAALQRVEVALTKNDGRPIEKIREELGITEISGLRRPKSAVGGTVPSLHCYGLAVDIGYKGNPYLQREISSQVIERATRLIFGTEKGIKLYGTDSSPSFDTLRSASDALKRYMALRKPENEQLLLSYTKTSEEAQKLRVQVQKDYESLRGKSGDFAGSHNPDLGFFNISETLVTALEKEGFSWGGRYCKRQDMMHFDLRNVSTPTGTIKR